ncbi:MAG: HigA family addiction module antidote protein [Lachnospiraceae bacterium]|nr:HigA family addiction module antidote protein [Lachnospiraceae bacterium]
MVRSRSFIAIPPGETIKELLEDRGMSQKELAVRLDMSEKHVSKLVNGEVQLTMDMARRLEMVLGPSAQFWCKLEAFYREDLVKANEENAMETDISIAKKLPYKEMVNLGWLEDLTAWTERVICLRKFFEVAQLSLLQEKLFPVIACRKLSDTEKSDLALLTWAQKAKLEARQIETGSLKMEGIKKVLPGLRKMTIMSPEEFCPELIRILAAKGVALVFLPHMKGSFLHGATFKDGRKIVVGLTVRGKDADKFWFSLFHELGHIILGHVGRTEGLTQAEEQDADAFAREVLIPKEPYASFVLEGEFGKASVCHFADSIGIDVGILVGRLQKDGFLAYNRLNELKSKYEFS